MRGTVRCGLDRWCFFLPNAILALVAIVCISRSSLSQDVVEERSVEEIRAVLDAIDPYLPKREVKVEIDVFGSTSMDSLAHGWATGFKQFHPDSKIVISAEGSETVFERLSKSPTSIGMLSRPVTNEDLEKLKKLGFKNPEAVMIAREALGIFVHASNPLDSVTYPQLIALFCVGTASDGASTWQAAGVAGPLADKPVELMGRDAESGTQSFIRDYIFRSQALRTDWKYFGSNAKTIAAVEENPNGIAICGLKCGKRSARALGLRDGASLIPSDDHAILTGRYPLIRPLTLVLDMGAQGPQADANREFVRYALGHSGQMQTILSGFFPFDPPTLRAEASKIEASGQN